MTVLVVLVGASSANGAVILIDNYYSSWIASETDYLENELKIAGHTVTYNTSSISAANLAGYDVYVIFFPGESHSISPAEADIIATWVEIGHGLWLGGSAGDGSVEDNCNTISSRWGITFQSDRFLDVITDITYGHAVTDGDNPPTTQVDNFDNLWACSLSLINGLALAHYGSKTVTAALEPGDGRAIFMGDSVNIGPFDDQYLYRYDNLALALNIVNYLATPEPWIEVAVDIKPGSCPNPLNVKSKGVLPIAILGTDDLDVTTIDPASIQLAGAMPLRSGYEDVAAPISDSNYCNCTTDGPDGFLDLTLKFMTQDIVATLGEVNHDDVLELQLDGVLYDETPIEGADCILIRGKHKPINIADINKDGVVNAVDFAIIAESWLESSFVGD